MTANALHKCPHSNCCFAGPLLYLVMLLGAFLSALSPAHPINACHSHAWHCRVVTLQLLCAIKTVLVAMPCVQPMAAMAAAARTSGAAMLTGAEPHLASKRLALNLWKGGSIVQQEPDRCLLQAGTQGMFTVRLPTCNHAACMFCSYLCGSLCLP